MSNPYGIELNQAWIEWAAEYGMSARVAAALYLISECRPIHKTLAVLAPDELNEVVRVIRQWPNQFPPVTLLIVERYARSREARTTGASNEPHTPLGESSVPHAQSAPSASDIKVDSKHLHRSRARAAAGLSARLHQSRARAAASASDRHTGRLGPPRHARHSAGGSEAGGCHTSDNQPALG